jgi:dihydrofolate synthase / folylpolyglutamate synthase
MRVDVKEAEGFLRGLDAIGWRLGLERMRRLCELLGLPQNRYATIHVVGTNGKTSVSRMTAALLEAHGVSTGAYLSPHLLSWRERIRLRGEPIPEAEFAAAIERCAEAAGIAERGFEEGEKVTQYELITAAAFFAFAQARLDAAVIEAGLGGRLDATNVIRSKVSVLTSVGLDHTEWLGDDVASIATEKLEVLGQHSTLVVGELPPEAMAVARRYAAERHAELVEAPAEPPAQFADLVPPGYQRRNLAIALTAADEFLGELEVESILRHAQAAPGRASGADAPRGTDAEQEAAFDVPGRAELHEGDPAVLYDTAHNPDGARALAESLPELTGGRPVVACLAVLADKDAAGICAALAPACEAAVCTEFPAAAVHGSGRPGGEAMAAERLAELWRAAGGRAEALSDPWEAWESCKSRAEGEGGVALAAGSHYLLRCLWTGKYAENS